MPADAVTVGLLQRVLREAASRRWTVVFFLLTAACALLVAQGGVPATASMLLPFALLAVNLLAAIVVNPRFRADLALLVFHLALLALVLLVALARLTYLDASTTLSRDTAFDGQPQKDERGPLHAGRIDALRFVNEGLRARYSEHGVYEGTYNRVRWLDAQGRWQASEIGDDRPLVLDGYRIYATKQRGLAPLFRWQPSDGEEQLGTVQLQDHRRSELPPSARWQLPGLPELWLQLQHTPPSEPKGRVQSELGAAELEHKLVIYVGDARHELRVGDTIALAQGRLTYVRLDSWMSYRLVYDPTVPWIVAALTLAVGSLIWFYARRIGFAARSGVPA